MLYELLSVSDLVAIVELGEINIIQIPTTEGLRHLKEQSKLIKVRLSYYTNHISQFHRACLQIANHQN